MDRIPTLSNEFGFSADGKRRLAHKSIRDVTVSRIFAVAHCAIPIETGSEIFCNPWSIYLYLSSGNTLSLKIGPDPEDEEKEKLIMKYLDTDTKPGIKWVDFQAASTFSPEDAVDWIKQQGFHRFRSKHGILDGRHWAYTVANWFLTSGLVTGDRGKALRVISKTWDDKGCEYPINHRWTEGNFEQEPFLDWGYAEIILKDATSTVNNISENGKACYRCKGLGLTDTTEKAFSSVERFSKASSNLEGRKSLQ